MKCSCIVFTCKTKIHVQNRAYPENNNFETFVPRNLKFHTFGDIHTTKVKFACTKFTRVYNVNILPVCIFAHANANTHRS